MRLLPASILIAFVTSLALVSCVESARASARPDSIAVVPGMLVRVHTSSAPSPLVGRFGGTDSTTLWLGGAEGATTEILRASVSRFEASRGKRNRPGEGAIIGLGVGVLSGTLLGLALRDDRTCEVDCVFGGGEETMTFLTAAAGGTLGLVIGLLVGSSIRREQWAPAQMPAETPP